MSQTYLAAVADYFRARPHVWLDGMEIAKVGGCYAHRTRVSNCRTKLGMTIENRQRKVGQVTVSEYRYVPPVVPVQAALFEQGEAR